MGIETLKPRLSVRIARLCIEQAIVHLRMILGVVCFVSGVILRISCNAVLKSAALMEWQIIVADRMQCFGRVAQR